MTSPTTYNSLHHSYYPHIDGVRTLAVLPIVIYHIFSDLCPGGYIGVDIFFVISGYLITLGILNSSKKNTFTIKEFYSKRIRRIIPAYGVLILFVLFSSVFIYIGPRLYNTITAAQYSACFITNFYFFFNSGYFADSSTNNPLLHLWSLSVEEQFYVLIPLLMLFSLKRSISFTFKCLLALALLSFLYSIYCNLRGAHVLNFFMLPTRAWELLAGSLLAFLPARASDKKLLPAVLAFIGILFCFVPFYLYDHGTLFPGVSALPPVIGAMLLIRYGDVGFVGTLLKSAPFVGVGKISYSLYLWHWPLIVYWNYYSFNSLNIWGLSGVFVLSFILAYASWRFVEMPVRIFPKWSFKWAVLLTALVCGSTLSIVFISKKVKPVTHAIALFGGNETFGGIGLSAKSKLDHPVIKKLANEGADLVRVLGEDSEPRFVLLGDSHAQHLVAGMQAYSLRNGINGVYIAKSTIPARYVNRLEVAGRDEEFNAEIVEAFLSWLERQSTIHYVVISSRLAMRVEGNAPDLRNNRHTYRHLNNPLLKDNPAVMREGIREFCVAVKAMNKEVLFLEPVPEQIFTVPLYWHAQAHPYKISIDYEPFLVTRQDYDARNKRSVEILRDLEREGLLGILPVADFFFHDNGKSRTLDNNGKLIYFDANHLTLSGSNAVVEYLDTKLNEKLKSLSDEEEN